MLITAVKSCDVLLFNRYSFASSPLISFSTLIPHPSVLLLIPRPLSPLLSYNPSHSSSFPPLPSPSLPSPHTPLHTMPSRCDYVAVLSTQVWCVWCLCSGRTAPRPYCPVLCVQADPYRGYQGHRGPPAVHHRLQTEGTSVSVSVCVFDCACVWVSLSVRVCGLVSEWCCECK
jgi:hypothetical protein